VKFSIKTASLSMGIMLLLVAAGFYFNVHDRVQVEDQSEPAAVFSLSQYKDTDDAMRFLVKKLPVGTDKKVVEEYIIQDSGAVATEIYSRTVSYSFGRPVQWSLGVTHHRCKDGWTFEVTYDEKNLLKSMRFPCF
jgi:hypothetical protein